MVKKKSNPILFATTLVEKATYKDRESKRRYENTARGKIVHAIAKTRRKIANCNNPVRIARLNAILDLNMAELRRISS